VPSPVIPAKAGIQEKQAVLDPGFRRGDGFNDFLRGRHLLRLSLLTLALGFAVFAFGFAAFTLRARA